MSDTNRQKKSEALARMDEVLGSRFKMAAFRKGQRDIIESVLNGRDALAVMPTGGGKSLCYQLPAVCREGLVVVISPLIALMRDQVRSLTALGIPAGALYSDQPLAEKQDVFARLSREKHFLLYLSPERVQKAGFAPWLEGRDVSLFAIDESHCVSQWGQDFRTDYAKLSLLRQTRPDVPILALTATATPPVLEDIVEQLGLREPDRHIHGFYRPNLYYQVESCDDESRKVGVLRQAIKQTPQGRILIYCGTRKQAEALVNDLGSEFEGMSYYHAGMDAPLRASTQKDYESGKLRILAATNAFGMGIDHPDVRLVAHYQMPANIESLYQEMGRAGRDGKDSTCLLLYSRKDKGLHSYFISKSTAPPRFIDRKWRALETMTQFAEGGECRHAGILTYFKDSQRIRACGHCDICAPQSPRRIAVTVAPPRTILRKKRDRAAAEAESVLSPEQNDLFDHLRAWRKAYAEERDMPAFLVFSNKTLRELAVRQPSTLSELEDIYGLGPSKIETFGEALLEALDR